MKLQINSYNKLSIRKYNEIMDILNEDISGIEKDIAIIAVLAGVTEDEVYKLSPSEVAILQSQLSFLGKPTLTNKKYKSIILNGTKYNIMKSLDKMSMAQYVDFQNLWEGDYVKKLPEVLSIFIIPDGHEYNEGYDIAQVRNEINENLDIETATNIAFFLRSRLESLIEDKVLYCRLMLWAMRMRTKDKELKKNLKNLSKLYKQMGKDLTSGLASSMRFPPLQD